MKKPRWWAEAGHEQKSEVGGDSAAGTPPSPAPRALELSHDCGMPCFYKRFLSACSVNGLILHSHTGSQNDDFVRNTRRAAPSGSGSEKPVKSQSSFPILERNQNVSESKLLLFFSPKPLSETSAALAPGNPSRISSRKGRRSQAEARAGHGCTSWAL